jgi:hypothetical protein
MYMIDNIIVIDDAISKNYQIAIEQRILADLNFPWFFVPNITKETHWSETLESDTVGLAHQFYDRAGSTGQIADFLLPLMYESCGKINFFPREIFYGRIFMTLGSKNVSKHNLLHVDMTTPHLVCLYYVNDSTGNTVFVDKTSNDVGQDVINNLENLKIIKEVTPKQGRVVLFNGEQYHASTNPASGRRCIINFDLG